MARLAITLQIILVLYHQAATLFDFFPFNGVRFTSRGEKLAEAAVNLALMTLPPIGFILRAPLLMKFGLVYYFILFGVECATWWAPWFLGPSPKWLDIYNRIHRQTITVLPRRANQPAPNLEHLILMALTLLTTIATFTTWRSLKLEFPQWWIGLLVGVVLIGITLFQFCFQGKAKSNAPPA